MFVKHGRQVWNKDWGTRNNSVEFFLLNLQTIGLGFEWQYRLSIFEAIKRLSFNISKVTLCSYVAKYNGDSLYANATTVDNSNNNFFFLQSQKDDKFLKSVYAWLSVKEEPSQNTIMFWGPEEKFLWINTSLLALHDGVICWNTIECDRRLQYYHDLASRRGGYCDLPV